MANQNVVEFTDQNFATEVLGAELPTLVDFWAVWCGPCKAIAPIVDSIADDYKGKLKVGKVDVDNNPLTAQQYGIRSIPTVLIFKGGKVVGQLPGAVPRSKFETEIGYSRAVVQGDWMFESGTTGFDYTAMTIVDDVAHQTEQCFLNIDAAMQQAGFSLADIVRVHYLLPDAEDFPATWPVLKKYLGDVKPAATIQRVHAPRQRLVQRRGHDRLCRLPRHTLGADHVGGVPEHERRGAQYGHRQRHDL